TAVSKYDSTRQSDYGIVLRVHELAEKYNATMTQVALAWQFAKGVTAPIHFAYSQDTAKPLVYSAFC
ncbi:MAG: aldo/keto reductase, partial [Oscillospiraceae bacterium]